MGKPWLAGQIAEGLSGKAATAPSLDIQVDSLCEQIRDSVALYGTSLGVRMVRKHVSAAIECLKIPLSEHRRRSLRAQMCQIIDPEHLISSLRVLYLKPQLLEAA